jgi:hypothetical protein
MFFVLSGVYISVPGIIIGLIAFSTMIRNNTRGHTITTMGVLLCTLSLAINPHVVMMIIPSVITSHQTTPPRMCKKNIANIENALAASIIDGKKVSRVADLVPKYIEREPSCPLGSSSYIIVSNTSVLCPNGHKGGTE